MRIMPKSKWKSNSNKFHITNSKKYYIEYKNNMQSLLRNNSLVLFCQFGDEYIYLAEEFLFFIVKKIIYLYFYKKLISI